MLTSGLSRWDRRPGTAWVAAGMDVFLSVKVQRCVNICPVDLNCPGSPRSFPVYCISSSCRVSRASTSGQCSDCGSRRGILHIQDRCSLSVPGGNPHRRKEPYVQGWWNLERISSYVSRSSWLETHTSLYLLNQSQNHDWASSLPAEITCPYPNVANAMWRAPANGQYQYRETVEFTCHPGFVIRGSRHITCGADGNWLPKPPECQPKCK